jgi:hypothetical protein
MSSSPISGVPHQVRDLLVSAARALLDAAAEPVAGDRYAMAHLAALRTTAALLAARARPVPRRGTPSLRSAWSLLVEVAPELSEWAAYFAAGAGKRVAAQAGLAGAVSEREADDLVRDAEAFLALVAGTVGVPVPVVSHQLVLAG